MEDKSIKGKTPSQIREIVMNSFKSGDKIHITKLGRQSVNKAPSYFKGAYNHFFCVEAIMNNSYREMFSITYSELYTGNTIIHELEDAA